MSGKRWGSCCAGAALAFLAVAGAHAVPVIPGAAGYGVSTSAGRGGTVYRVTNLKENGRGSIGECVGARGPRVCVFETSGSIRLSNELVVRHPNLTIAGQTAPSPGIMLRGAGLRIQASDVLVQHIRVRPGDDLRGPPPDNRDALKVEGSARSPVNNVVIDHCSFEWSIDEVASAWAYWDNVSFLNSIFAEPLNNSLHPDSGMMNDNIGHGYGVLFGANDGSVSMVGNLLAHQVERNPLSRAARFVFVNNVVYNRANMDIELQSENGVVSSNTIVGNVFIRGRDYTRKNRPVLIYAEGSLAVRGGTRVYLSDNIADDKKGDASSLLGLSGHAGNNTRPYEASSPPVWPEGLVARPAVDDNVLDYVLFNAGARPTDRDSVDERIVASVRNRTGHIINCVSADGSDRCAKNAGGWPAYPVRTRELRLPDDPDALGADGYTNLERWLQSLSAALQGESVNGPQPPDTVRVR